MVDAQKENQKEKERQAGAREERIKRWPIIPLVGGPVGILILLCYVATAKPPAPVARTRFAGVVEQDLLDKAEALKSQAEQLCDTAEREDDLRKKNELCDKALELCWEAQGKFEEIRGAYEEQEEQGILEKGKTYQWEESNRELNQLINRIKFIRGF